MNVIWITLAIGAFLIIVDWHLATKPEPTDKIQRRKPMTVTQKRMMRDLFIGTFVAAGVAWLIAQGFD